MRKHERTDYEKASGWSERQILVSAEHCEVCVTAANWALEDRGSDFRVTEVNMVSRNGERPDKKVMRIELIA